jgi:hypothetical protein
MTEYQRPAGPVCTVGHAPVRPDLSEPSPSSKYLVRGAISLVLLEYLISNYPVFKF